MRLCLKSETTFDKILRYNIRFFIEHVEIGGREAGVCGLKMIRCGHLHW